MNVNQFFKLLLFLLLPIVFSCEPSFKDKLQGVWVGAYCIENDQDSFPYAFDLLWQIKDTTIIQKGTAYIESSESDTFTYKFVGDSLIIKDEEFKIKVANNFDSLVKEIYAYNTYSKGDSTYDVKDRKIKFVFKKLKDYQQFTIEEIKNNMVNQSFTFENHPAINNIEFLNDSIALLEFDSGYYYLDRWNIVHSPLYSFLRIHSFSDDWSGTSMYFIKQVNKQEVKTDFYFTKINEMNLVKHQSTPLNNLNSLKGKWVEDRTDVKQEFPYPDEYKNMDKRLHLNITDSVIYLQKMLRKLNLRWISNSKLNFIIFPEKLRHIQHSLTQEIWEIIKLTDNELILKSKDEYVTPFLFENRQTIRFYRE